MKKIMIGLSIFTMTAISVQAQQADQPAPQQKHFSSRRHQHGRMLKQMNFSDQQQQQLKTIKQDYRNKLATLRKNEDITVRELKQKMRVLRKERHAQVQALLTADQKNQLLKMHQTRQQLAKVNAGARAERMKIKLGLSDNQANQVKNLRSAMVTKTKAIRTDSTLTYNKKREQVKSLVMQHKEALKTVLTPAQQDQLDQMKKDHWQHQGK